MTTDNNETQKLYRSAIHMLSLREHSQKELQQKLSLKGFEQPAINDLLTELIKKDWLNQQRYSQAYIHSRSQRGYGWRYIQHILKQKGICQTDMNKALEKSEPIDWFTLAIKARHKRFGHQKPILIKDRQKQQQFLYNRGFDNEQIKHALLSTVIDT